MTAADVDAALHSLGHGVPASAFESDHLEFKEPADSTRKTMSILAETAVCLANADGGLIVLGVNDKATTRAEALVGVDERHYPVDQIRRGIFERTAPPLTLLAEERHVDGVRLVILRVPPAVAIHSTTAGLALRRLGDQCVPFTPAEQRELLIARGQYDWSAEPSKLPVDAVSPEQLGRLRRRLRLAEQGDLAKLPDRRLLETLNLLSDDLRLTNAAAILLTDEETLHRAIPAYGYAYQYRPAPSREPTSRFRGHRAFLEALELLQDAVELRSEFVPLNVHGLQQLQLFDYPRAAVRELLVNAFLHRSYEMPGTVEVEHSPMRLTIWSPGGLVTGVTPRNILVHLPVPRNPLLADVVARLRLAERTGLGVDRAYWTMLRAGKEPPEFSSNHDVEAVLRGGTGNPVFAKFVNELPSGVVSEVDVLLALSALRSRPTLTAARLSQLTQRSPVDSEEVLRRLADDEIGILEPTRRTARQRFRSYRLRSQSLAQLRGAVTYGTHTMDEVDGKVIKHVREFGSISNAALQRMFDIPVFTARNVLTDLRERGILEKLGDARGGRGVKYGPGDRFPAGSQRPTRKNTTSPSRTR